MKPTKKDLKNTEEERKKRTSKMIYRRRGVVIVNTTKGILVVKEKDGRFSLPGGGAKKHESREKAAIRELYEETELKTKKITYLFSYLGEKWHYGHHKKSTRNNNKVFLIKASGNPKPMNEIKCIDFWRPGK